MAARGKIEGRSNQAPGMMRHGSYPGVSAASGHHPLENRIATQAEEIERLAGDNRRLANTDVALRKELVAAEQEVQKVKAHMRSIQTESDIQIRVLVDKIAKMEKDVRAGESVKKDLQQAHIDAQSLAAARQELGGQIQRATLELQKARSDIKLLPDLQAEMDSLAEEQQSVRATFEYEKNKNIELVEQMKATEKNLIAMAKEVEILRAEILNAEKSVCVQGSGGFIDVYGRAHAQMAVSQVGERVIPYGDSNGVTAVNSAGGGSAVWAGQYDPSVGWR